MLFKDVIGQGPIKSQFIQTVREERVSHALMLTGEEGYGALPLSLAFAQYILCEDRQPVDGCGVCPACQKVQKLIHPDLHFVFPISNIKNNPKPVCDDFLQEWREALLEDPYLSAQRWYQHLGIENKLGMIYTQESNEILKKLSLKTFEAEYKVMIIWQPERMHPTCSNKLLKIVEEPPPKTLFILVSLFPGQIIPTLLSRVQRMEVPRIDEGDLLEGMKQRFKMNGPDLKRLAKIADGSFTQAREFLHLNEEHAYNLDQFIQWMRLCYQKDVPSIINWVDDMSALGRERKKSFLLYALRMIRENFLMNSLPDDQDRMVKLSEEESKFSRRFSSFIKEENVFNLYSELNKAIADIEANAYAKTVFLDLSIRVMGQLRK